MEKMHSARGHAHGCRAAVLAKATFGASTRGAIALVLVWPILAKTSAQRSVNATPALAFDRVTVVDVEQGGLVPDQRVVILGNRIQTVGDTGVVKMPKGCRL
jgi:hypothetical protein